MTTTACRLPGTTQYVAAADLFFTGGKLVRADKKLCSQPEYLMVIVHCMRWSCKRFRIAEDAAKLRATRIDCQDLKNGPCIWTSTHFADCFKVYFL